MADRRSTGGGGALSNKPLPGLPVVGAGAGAGGALVNVQVGAPSPKATEGRYYLGEAPLPPPGSGEGSADPSLATATPGAPGVGVEKALQQHHAQDCQQDKGYIDNLVTRIDSWSYVTDSLIPFIKEMHKIEKSAAKSYLKLSSNLQYKGNDGFSGVSDGIKSLKGFTSNVGLFHDNFAKYLEENTLDALQKLQKDVQAKAKTLRKRLQSESLQHVREPAVAAIQTYSKTYEGVLSHESTLSSLQALRAQGLSASSVSPRDRSSSLTQGDPWLLEMKVKSELASLVANENEYKDNVIKIVKEVEQTDVMIARTLKDTFDRFAKWRGRQILAMRDEASDIEKKMDGIRPEAEWHSFASEKGLNNLALWQHKVAVEDFDYPYKNGERAKILKQGTLFRQGRIVSSNWKKAYFILTQTGWLHCFESKETAFGAPGKQFPADLIFSFDIKESTVNMPTDEKDIEKYKNCVFELRIKGKKELVKANNEEEMVDWVCVIKELVYASTARVEEVIAPHEPPAETAGSENNNTVMVNVRDDAGIGIVVGPDQGLASPRNVSVSVVCRDEEGQHYPTGPESSQTYYQHQLPGSTDRGKEKEWDGRV